ncbi:putative reverse transcriptase domain-containing protein [Tanacetum coccineum]
MNEDPLPQKEKYPGSFTLPCYINNVCFKKALADLGASVSVMPLTTFTNLGLGDLAPTKLIGELADRTIKYPKGVADNVLVGIGKFIFPVDFVVLDMPEDVKVPFILGRPFLSTAHAKIDVFKREITLRHPIVTIPLLPDFGGVTDGTRAKNPSSLSDIHARVFPDPYLLFRLIMPPRRFKKKSVRKIVEKHVTKAIEKYKKTRADSNNTGGSGSTNTGGTVVPEMHGCSYKTFMNGKPHSFKGTEDDKVKFAMCTFKGRALTWWNGNVQTLGLANANQIPWSNVKAMMTTEYCPATEIQRMEQEL